MSSVQKKTQKKGRSKDSKVAKSKHHKKDRKHRSKDGKRRDGKVKKARSRHGKPSKGASKGTSKGVAKASKGAKKGPKKASKDPKKKTRMSEIIEGPKRSPVAKPNSLPVSPHAVVDKKKKKEEKKVEKEKEVEKKQEKKEVVKSAKKEEKKVAKTEESPPKTAKTGDVVPPERKKSETLEVENTQLSEGSIKKKQGSKGSGEKVEKTEDPPVEKKKSGSGSKKKKEEKAESPEAKTPDQLGPALIVEGEKEEEVEKKMDKSRSLKATQTYKSSEDKSPPKAPIGAPIPDENGDLPMQSTPPSESDKMPKNLRSDQHGLQLIEGNPADNLLLLSMKKVDIDLIGRTGMYMERGRNGMAQEKKQAFDWIAYNRHDLTNKQAGFSQSLAVALGDVGIGNHLAQRTLIYLKSHGQITQPELHQVLLELKTPTVSFSQLSSYLRKHCETYKINEPAADVLAAHMQDGPAPVMAKKKSVQMPHMKMKSGIPK